MKNEKLRFITAMTLLFVALPTVAGANVVWPSLYIVTGMMSWYIIIAGLIIEVLFIRFILKPTWVKSIVMAVGMNIASAVLGLFFIPFTGFIATILYGLLPFAGGTFDLVLWGISYILAVLCNVGIEGLFLRLVFKLSFKKNFLWLVVANALSVIFAILVLGFTMRGIMGM